MNNQTSEQAVALTEDWYKALEHSANSSFVLLPIELQARGYDYNFIASRYVNYLRDEELTRKDKLMLGKKFFKFIKIINRNRAKEELGLEFFECFNYVMENFSELLSKQDLIQVESLDLIMEGLDKAQFVEDIISFDEIQRRAKKIQEIEEQEKIIDAEWEDVEKEYRRLNYEPSKA